MNRKKATVIARLPIALPTLCVEFEEVTVGRVLDELQGYASALARFAEFASRLERRALEAAQGTPPERRGAEIADEWHAQHIEPVLEALSDPALTNALGAYSDAAEALAVLSPAWNVVVGKLAELESQALDVERRLCTAANALE